MEKYSFENIDFFTTSVFVGLILIGFHNPSQESNSDSGIQLEGTKTFPP